MSADYQPEAALLRKSLTAAEEELAAAQDKVLRLRKAISTLESPKPLYVSPDRVELVAVYLQHNSPARQSDIQRELSLNPGAVSVALRRLEDDGRARKMAKENRSRVWEWAGEAPVAAPKANSRRRSRAQSTA